MGTKYNIMTDAEIGSVESFIVERGYELDINLDGGGVRVYQTKKFLIESCIPAGPEVEEYRERFRNHPEYVDDPRTLINADPARCGSKARIENILRKFKKDSERIRDSLRSYNFKAHLVEIDEEKNGVFTKTIK